MKRRITETLQIDLESETWHCHRCDHALTDADNQYKRGCNVRQRNPREIHRQFGTDDEYNFTPHPDWARILEYICPGCGTLIEVEYLPPGHPITHDIELDIESLKEEEEMQ